MAVASRVGVPVPLKLNETSAEFSQTKPSSSAVSNSRFRCLPSRGENRRSSCSQQPRGWRTSEVAPEVVRRAMVTSTRSRASQFTDGFDDSEICQLDRNVQRRRPLRPVVERFNIVHEKNVGEERLKELGVSRWSKWECGPGVTTFWKWKVDELVYISKGSVEVVPDGCHDAAIFRAGDLVRFPKWFEGSLTFDENYEQCYKFFAYGD